MQHEHGHRARRPVPPRRREAERRGMIALSAAIVLGLVLVAVLGRATNGERMASGAQPAAAAATTTAPATSDPPQDLDGGPETEPVRCKLKVRTIELGAKGKSVTCLQRALAHAGAYTGEITSTFDKATEAAVRKVQRQRELTVDGLVGEQTAVSLGIWPGDGAWVVRTPPPPPGATDRLGFPLSSVSSVGRDAPPLPPNSGSGRRLVYDRAGQRVWAVDENDYVIRSWLVSGSIYGNEVPGTHKVYSRSEVTTAWNGAAYLPLMVRWLDTVRGAIGFHAIPLHVEDNSTYQTEDELGTPFSGAASGKPTPTPSSRGPSPRSARPSSSPESGAHTPFSRGRHTAGTWGWAASLPSSHDDRPVAHTRAARLDARPPRRAGPGRQPDRCPPRRRDGHRHPRPRRRPGGRRARRVAARAGVARALAKEIRAVDGVAVEHIRTDRRQPSRPGTAFLELAAAWPSAAADDRLDVLCRGLRSRPMPTGRVALRGGRLLRRSAPRPTGAGWRRSSTAAATSTRRVPATPPATWCGPACRSPGWPSPPGGPTGPSTSASGRGRCCWRRVVDSLLAPSAQRPSRVSARRHGSTWRGRRRRRRGRPSGVNSASSRHWAPTASRSGHTPSASPAR